MFDWLLSFFKSSPEQIIKQRLSITTKLYDIICFDIPYGVSISQDSDGYLILNISKCSHDKIEKLYSYIYDIPEEYKSLIKIKDGQLS